MSCILVTMLHLSQQELELTVHQRSSNNNQKISPRSNCMGVSTEFSKFARGRSKTVMMHLGDVIVRMII